MDAIERTIDRPLDEAEKAVREALLEEGFGILTEIDVAATLEAKLGVHRAPLKILGACNPELAHRALDMDPALALVLPCNVVLEALADRRTRVAIVDPRALLAAGKSPAGSGPTGAGSGPPGESGDLEALGARAASSLERALSRIAG